MFPTIVMGILALTTVGCAGWIWYTIWSERQFHKRYSEFKRQQRRNRDKFFSDLNREDQS